MNAGDKVLDHTREQLSALFDGELALDEARFLERRLQHDAALAGCVSRWQAIGDALRGQALAPAPAGFAARVAAAVAAETGSGAASTPASHRAHGSRRGWVPGAALAASVALVALFATRQAGETPEAGAPATQVAQAAVPDATSAPIVPVQAPAEPAPVLPGHEAGQLAAAVVVAEVPRRAAARRAPISRGQSQRAATTRVARADEAQPQFALANATGNAAATTVAVAVDATANPFAPADAAALPAVAAKPWPRALLPGAGTFTVGYGNLQPEGFHHDAAPGNVVFHPFRVRPGLVPSPAPVPLPSEQE